MNSRSRDWLEEIVYTVRYVQSRIAGRTASDYVASEDLRSIIERKFEIIGENVVRLRDHDPITVSRISNFQQIIGLRNVIAHAYGTLDHRQMWEFANGSLPILLDDAERLLDDDPGA